MSSWMRFLRRLDESRAPSGPYFKAILEFATYLNEERGLAASTIKTKTWFLTRFFNFGFGKLPLDRLAPKHVAEALRIAGEQGWTRGGIEQRAAALKSFFTFAASRDLCKDNLAAAAVGGRRYQGENLPQGPPWEDVQRLLTSMVSDRPMDVRDRAIFLLLAIYGFRVSEVCRLKLDDLDWANEQVAIVHAKGGRPRLYPLTEHVGQAIIRYLRQTRPVCSRREVFLAMNAPYRPLTQGAIYNSLADRFRRLGVSAPKLGLHGLRHACATHLLAQGTTMTDISSHLGHRQFQPTRIYARSTFKDFGKSQTLIWRAYYEDRTLAHVRTRLLNSGFQNCICRNFRTSNILMQRSAVKGRRFGSVHYGQRQLRHSSP